MKGHMGKDGALIHALLCPVASNDTLPDYEPKTLENYTKSHCFGRLNEHGFLAPADEPIEVVCGVQDTRKGCVLSYTSDEQIVDNSIVDNIWAYTILTLAGALSTYFKA